jgi:hypothetical protein
MADGISKWVATSSEYRPDRYYRYEHLTGMLHNWATQHPSITQVESIGKTYEGRDIWVMTLTNVNTGAASE